MGDISIHSPSVEAVPKQYLISGSAEIVLKGVTASFDGTAASGSFIPAVQIVDPSGIIVGTYIAGSTLAAGASADVSWFPGVNSGGGALDTTDGVTSVSPTTELLIGGGLSLTAPASGTAELSADFANIIHGRVSSGSSPTFTGSGFTGVRTGTGAYTITFTPALSQTPSIAVSAYGDGANVVNAASANQSGSLASGTSFTVVTYNPAATVARDCGFDFLAIPTGSGGGGGPRFPVQTIVEKDGNYNAFPWVCYMHDGTTLIAAYRKGATHASVDGQVVIQTSADGGSTWSGETVLFTPAAGHDYRDPSVCLTATGRLIINFFDYDGANVLGIYTSHSDDNAATWSALPAILTPYTSASNKGATSGGILATSGGTLLMPVYGRNGADAADRMGVLRSSDNGATWSAVVNISGAASNLNEATLIQLASGTVRAFIREDTTPAPIHVCDSADSGATWGTITALGWNVTRGRPAAIRSQSTGTIFLMYRGLTGPEYPSYRYSQDNGVTWSAENLYSVSSQYEYAGGIARPGTDQIAAVVGAQLGVGGECEILFFTWVVS